MANTIAVLIGSLRKESFTRKVAKAAIALAPKDMEFEFIEIGDLPLYNQDNENNDTAAIKTFKQKVAAVDAVLFATPEYNRALPGVLKNAIDIGSRPYGHSVWNGKPTAVLSVSPGNMGGFGAAHDLRQVLSFLNMPVMGQPEAYVGGASSLVDDNGEVTVESTREFLTNFMKAFDVWIARLK